MALQMKEKCELCNQALAHSDEAYICSYECTFCRECAEGRRQICPNCQGELFRRPSRKMAAAS
ncbi:MAG: DUF1272 domain-containing protein [Candidatus Acidiferrales bacterium]